VAAGVAVPAADATGVLNHVAASKPDATVSAENADRVFLNLNDMRRLLKGKKVAGERTMRISRAFIPPWSPVFEAEPDCSRTSIRDVLCEPEP
jgi:hypothetical protein